MNHSRLLLIDDDEVDRISVVRLLRNHYEIVEAATASQGLRILNSRNVDCVLLDYQLPDADGLTLLPQIVQQKVPVVMLTGMGNEQVAVDALKLGAQDYLIKGMMSTAGLMKSINDAISQIQMQRTIEEQHEEMELFSYTVAHDLKSPLRSMAVFAKLISDAVHGRVNPQVDAHLETIQNQAQQMSQLIDDLLEYANLSRSVKPLLPVELNSVVDAVRQQLHSRLRTADARLEIQDLPLVQGDRVALHQLLQNLLENSVKFRQHHRQLQISISAQPLDGAWQFSVTDNGIGIDPKFHRDIFTPLQRIHAGTDVGGSGIGLAICKRIIGQHRGKIWVHSTPGAGSTFYFTLPCVSHSSS